MCGKGKHVVSNNVLEPCNMPPVRLETYGVTAGESDLGAPKVTCGNGGRARHCLHRTPISELQSILGGG